jgi:hypothetical protein
MQTLTNVPVDLRLKVSPKLNVNERLAYTAVLNPQQTIYRNFPSQQFSSSNFNINCVFNATSLIDVATAVIQNSFQLTFTGVAGDGVNLLQMRGSPTAPGVSAGLQNYDAPRAYPLAAILSTLSVQFENTSVNSQINRYWPCISRYYNPRESQDLYQCPAMLDNSQEYDDNPSQSAIDPLGSFSGNSAQQSRGGWSDMIILQNDPTIAVVQFTTYEPIYISPFVFGANRREMNNATPLCGINNLIINGTYSGNNGSLNNNISPLSRIWSHRTAVGGSTFTGINVQVLSVSANISYFQSPITFPLPRSLCYPFVEYVPVQTQNSQPLLLNQSTQISFNTQTLTSIPKCVYIFVARQNALDSYLTTDSAIRIDSVKIIFNGQDGILSSATPQQLYNMSRANGLIDNYSDFRTRVGSYICLNFGNDIPFNSADLATGVNGNFDFSMTVDCTNISKTNNLLVSLNVVFCYEGMMMNNGSQFSQTTGVLTRNDMIDLQKNARATGNYVTFNPEEQLNGGSFLKKAWNVLKAPARILLKNLPATSGAFRAAEIACEASGNRSSLCNFVRGNGLDGGEMDGGDFDGGDFDGGDDGGYLGGRRRKSVRMTKSKSRSKSRGKRSKKGCGFDGGAMLSRSQLKQLMN